ncbi:MAG: DUF6057 family protein [Tannerellaceae bacterium]|nr:DUF6057 family protein [Tannerellaceae bacterium]
MEQFQLFQLTQAYLVEKVSLPGGLALWLSEWLVQYLQCLWRDLLLLLDY